MSRNQRLVQREIAGWKDRGLIDTETARRLDDDVAARTRAFSVSGALIVMSALLFSASVLILIAANWEGLSRLSRFALIATIVVTANGTGAWAASLGRTYLADALWLIGSAAFGAGMALVAQMYHLSGSNSGLYLVWWLSAVVSATLLRSNGLTLGAIGLACAWAVARLGDDGFSIDGDLPPAIHALVPMLAIGWAISLWTQARLARDLALLAFGGYMVLLSLSWGAGFAALAMALSAAVFVMVARDGRQDDPAIAPRASFCTHALLQFVVAGILLHVEWSEGLAMAVVATIIIVGLIGALLLDGRDGPGVRRLVYAAFAGELIFIYIQTVGTMLGTFGFLVVGAAALAIFARLVTRFERRARVVNGEAA